MRPPSASQRKPEKSYEECLKIYSDLNIMNTPSYQGGELIAKGTKMTLKKRLKKQAERREEIARFIVNHRMTGTAGALAQVRTAVGSPEFGGRIPGARRLQHRAGRAASGAAAAGSDPGDDGSPIGLRRRLMPQARQRSVVSRVRPGTRPMVASVPAPVDGDRRLSNAMFVSTRSARVLIFYVRPASRSARSQSNSGSRRLRSTLTSTYTSCNAINRW